MFEVNHYICYYLLKKQPAFMSLAYKCLIAFEQSSEHSAKNIKEFINYDVTVYLNILSCLLQTHLWPLLIQT